MENEIEGATCDPCANCGKVDPICQCWKKSEPIEIKEPEIECYERSL